MLGFLIGTACLIGLVKVVRGRRRFGFGPWSGHGCHHGMHGHGGHGEHGGWRGGGGRGALRYMFERLETTPGQEKVVMAAVEDLRTHGQGAKEKLRAATSEVAATLRSDVFDEAGARAGFEKMENVVIETREAMLGALGRVHEALDSRQRQELAAMLEKVAGKERGFGFGPYRL